ncbi:MAG TPA: DUF4388 domain-containing protein [Acidobacteriota bacterium]|nr:DUF4388 domain-containing protein [Acidobacteriota bacterium]
MEKSVPDETTREALSIVGQYLSDTIPPVQASEPVSSLMTQPAEFLVSEILDWVSVQCRTAAEDMSTADYIYHSASKLHYLAHLQLISKKELKPYLDDVERQLLEYCPPEDRAILEENFGRLGTSDTVMNKRIGPLCRQGMPDAAEPGKAGSGHRRLALMRERLNSARRHQNLPAGGMVENDPIPQILATAISDVRTSEEFRRLQKNLQSLGIDPGTDEIYSKLSQCLPGWVIASTGAEAVTSHNPAIEAMRQMISLSENHDEGAGRFEDMVQAAVEQFNKGHLARAATIFDLALSFESDKNVHCGAASIRKTAHASINQNRLREYVKIASSHRQLLKVLNFFHAFSIENMLESLRTEENRNRRRLFLDLIGTYGEKAHRIAFERIKPLVSSTGIATDWHYARNLLCILTKTPRPADIPVEEEIDLVSPFTRPTLPTPLIKEAVRFFSRTKHKNSEKLLISAAGMLERTLLEQSAPSDARVSQVSLLDRIIFSLADYGTPETCRKAIKHGLLQQAKLGDTTTRLSYLSNQDLSSDKENVSLLVTFLKKNLPLRLLGMTIQKNNTSLAHAIKALSSSPAPAVRQALGHISARFPDTEFGRAAAGVLKGFDMSGKMEEAAAHTLAGDLDLFSLPDLLEQLAQLQSTGILTLKDERGYQVGAIRLFAGQINQCDAGRMHGEEAVYQLIEKTLTGTFRFQSKKDTEPVDTDGHSVFPDLPTLLAEGKRRYDALQRACAIVPDFSLLKRKANERAPHGAGKDIELARQLWEKMAGGASPEMCEADCLADSYRIRTILAGWVESGMVTVE